MTIRLALTAGLVLSAGAAMAHPEFISTFNKAFKPAPGTTLPKPPCAVCHVGMSPKLNPYGADLQKAMKAAKTAKLTPSIFAKVANLDSDKDGAKNGAEMKAGTLPGDPASKPAAKKPAAKKPAKGGAKKHK